MLVGSAEVLVAPAEKVVFVEDLAPEEMQVSLRRQEHLYVQDVSAFTEMILVVTKSVILKQYAARRALSLQVFRWG